MEAREEWKVQHAELGCIITGDQLFVPLQTRFFSCSQAVEKLLPYAQVTGVTSYAGTFSRQKVQNKFYPLALGDSHVISLGGRRMPAASALPGQFRFHGLDEFHL
jgi:hypothetical protein